MDLAFMDREKREQLLHSTTITLVVKYSGTKHRLEQLAAAENVVARDRYRQLCDQAKAAGSTPSSVKIEFPAHALEAAIALCAVAETNPDEIYMRERGGDTHFLQIDLGPILPGYLMEILDWYCRALSARQWKDFLPADPSVQEYDKFFWLYIYITMRKLGMHDFANTLGGPFIGILVEQHGLVDHAWMLDFLLEQLQEGDALFQLVAERYLQLEQAGRSPLFPEQWSAICKAYPHFGNLVTKLQGFQDLFGDAVREMERLGIDDGVDEDMEL
ncbi:uncharacterized protein N0V89_001520 [Didymosphaeria variabile]|uniref:Uncharacterized protein n=1 Tax=Didymosphaeria variabile TaxID=1932322 RepID=A0A9W9CGX0_9PLEO|nr:uncharacterized protein N0V89_001520 [Didymosphaeria variabile]KAJ4360951.1 hypothetical protein N0V89_001520 [Didymosphaeria variabile]